MDRKIKKLTDINLNTEEGELLIAAIGFITSMDSVYKENPDFILNDLIKARNERIKEACIDIMKDSMIFGHKIVNKKK